MNPNTNLWLSLGGMATVLAVLGAIGLWALRMVVRDELRPMTDDLSSVKLDVATLKGDVAGLKEAVFQEAQRG